MHCALIKNVLTIKWMSGCLHLTLSRLRLLLILNWISACVPESTVSIASLRESSQVFTSFPTSLQVFVSLCESSGVYGSLPESSRHFASLCESSLVLASLCIDLQVFVNLYESLRNYIYRTRNLIWLIQGRWLIPLSLFLLCSAVPLIWITWLNDVKLHLNLNIISTPTELILVVLKVAFILEILYRIFVKCITQLNFTLEVKEFQ